MGSELISFNLQSRHSANGSWVDLTGINGSLNLLTIWRFNVVKGANYDLRYRVMNNAGWS